MSESPVLDYDGENFFFCHSSPQSLPWPITMRSRGVAGFRGRFPLAVMGANAFKKAFPEGRATKAAVEAWQKIKPVEEEIKNLALVKKLEKNFSVAPYQHQRAAIEWLLHYDRLALLFEQGLGKTYISLMAIQCLKELGAGHKTLVIAPSIVYQSWIYETGKYTDLKVLPYRGDPDERREQRGVIGNQNWDLVVTTFDMLLERKKTPSAVYELMWQNLAEASRREYSARWKAMGIINNDDLDLLNNGGQQKSWLRDCARILREIPSPALPHEAMRRAKQSESSYYFLGHQPFDNIIVDEASRCLDFKSQRSVAIDSLASKTRRCWLLSGTLCVGRPTDMFSPMNILDRDILNMSWTKFRNTFCVTARSNPNIITGYKNLDRLKVLTLPHIFARKRSECIDLPERIFQKRYYEPTPEMVRLYNEVVKEDEVAFNGVVNVVASMLVKITKCLQILNGFVYYEEEAKVCAGCGHVIDCIARGITQGSAKCKIGGAPKIGREVMPLKSNPKIDLLSEDLDDCENEKVIIWAWYAEDLRAIADLLNTRGIKFISAKEEDCARKFEEDDSIRAFIGQTAQGIGITLNSATCAIYYSHGAALEPRLQSMDRNYRIGQNKPVIVKDYLSAGTIEETLVGLLAHKKDVREFMQSRFHCVACGRASFCLENNIEYLHEECVFFGERDNAEKIYRLGLRPIE